jgi:hypothetical protein
MSVISGSSVTGAGGPAGPDPRDYFNTVLYTGNGNTGQTVSGVGFQPDLVFLNNRSTGGGYPKEWFDAVRGAGLMIRSNGTDAEVTRNQFDSFTSDGFNLPAGYGNSFENDGSGAGQPYVAWNWKADGAGSSNTDGTITSTVSANTDAGFSIVTYTGNGSAGATVGHGLGVAPSMVIVKERQNANAWCVYHSSIGATKFLRLNGTDAEETQTDIWNDTEPSSSAPYVFTVGDAPATNRNANNLVAYCFAEIADFSKFGSYTGNGSATGPSVTTDFEPTFLLVKRSDSTGPWVCYDYARSPSNPRNKYLFWNDTSVEGTGLDVDFNSTSFQIKSSNANVNASGGTYIYMCIA